MEEEKSSRDIGANSISRSVGIIMVILYIALGITIIFNIISIPQVSQEYNRVFGIMLVAYGLFRGYKVYRRYFSRSES